MTTGTRAPLRAALLSWAALALAGRLAAAQPAPDDGVLARVDGEPISVALFQSSFARFLGRTGANDTERARRLHLETLVDARLLAEEARRRGYQDADYDRFVERVLRQATADRFFGHAFVDSLPEPTDAELREAYRRDSERRRVRHLAARSAAEADSLHALLEAGADFRRLAADRTGEPDSTAGLLGYVSYRELDDAFSEAAFSLDPGRPSKPVRSRHGYHLILVEDVLRNPLLTETAYRARRPGLAALVKLRRLQVEGDRFVRGYLERLAVRTDAEAVRRLGEVLREALAPPAGEGPGLTAPGAAEVAPEQLRAAEAAFSPGTPLLTYELDGVRRRFTAADYFRWLPVLPADEARGNVAASVGRALRDEVFADRGLRLRLDEDPRVREAVRHEADLYLAARLREQLRAHPSVRPTGTELREAFRRLGYDRRSRVRGDFWLAPFDSLAAAQRALALVGADPERAAALPGYRRLAGEDFRGRHRLTPHLLSAPVGRTILVVTADGRPHLLHVAAREEIPARFEDHRAELEALLTRNLSEIRLLQRLRAAARIEVNETLFARLAG